jgi:pyrroline-5-carboxylate reductase
MTTVPHVPQDDYRVAVIGSGQLACSFLIGLLASGFPPHRCIGLQRSGPRQRFARTDHATSLCGVEWTGELEKLPLDVTVLAVKPKDIGAIARSMRDANRRPGILLSTVAGVSLAELTAAFAPSVAVVRCMPNLGAAVRRSSTLVWPYFELSIDARSVVDQLFGAVGSIWPMSSEDNFDGCTAFAGAGIAYLARMALALTRAGERLGLDEASSAAIARELCVATGALLDTPAATPDLVMAGVASPGGMTERALGHLDREGLDRSVIEAMRRSLNIHHFLEAKIESVAK